jgi:translocator protein
MLTYSLILVPQLLSLLMQLLFPSDFSTNKKVFFQPPGYVFGIVWTLIYIMLGFYLYLLVQQRKSNQYFTYMLTLFVINLLFNLSWTPIVNIHKKFKLGILLIALMIFTLFLLISIDNKPVNRSLLIPYLSWLFLALLLNVELARNST